MKNIEVEIRSFIDKKKYDELVTYFDINAKLEIDDHQETFYFDTEQDLRIQRNDLFAKLWLKGGEIHDEQREEIEVKFNRSDFEELEKIFSLIGHQTKIKWYRYRRQYSWEGITVCLDATKGYGYIIELEKLCGNDGKDAALIKLKKRFELLGIPLTPKAEFDDKFNFYQQNWQSLIREENTNA